MDIAAAVRNFIIENFLFGEESRLKDDVSLSDEGIIDSTGILELVGFLEEEFHLTVEDSELIPENLDSVDNLTAYVSKKMTGSPPIFAASNR